MTDTVWVEVVRGLGSSLPTIVLFVVILWWFVRPAMADSRSMTQTLLDTRQAWEDREARLMDLVEKKLGELRDSVDRSTTRLEGRLDTLMREGCAARCGSDATGRR